VSNYYLLSSEVDNDLKKEIEDVSLHGIQIQYVAETAARILTGSKALFTSEEKKKIFQDALKTPIRFFISWDLYMTEHAVRKILKAIADSLPQSDLKELVSKYVPDLNLSKSGGINLIRAIYGVGSIYRELEDETLRDNLRRRLQEIAGSPYVDREIQKIAKSFL
jgi:hypothetical protein